jgi:hypothetical protein
VIAVGDLGYLLTQFTDEYVDYLALGLVHYSSVKMLEEHVLRDGRTLVQDQQLQDGKFFAR